MSIITFVALLIFGLLDLISVVMEIFRRRTAGSNGLKEPTVVRRRRIWLHLGVWVLIIGGFWAIIQVGPFTAGA